MAECLLQSLTQRNDGFKFRNPCSTGKDDEVLDFPSARDLRDSKIAAHAFPQNHFHNCLLRALHDLSISLSLSLSPPLPHPPLMEHNCSDDLRRDGINLGGAAVGAVMSFESAAGIADKERSNCSDAYINSNVQGITNSFLIGCTVIVKDAGASCLLLRRRSRCHARRRCRRRAPSGLLRPYLPAGLLLVLAFLGLLKIGLSL